MLYYLLKGKDKKSIPSYSTEHNVE